VASPLQALLVEDDAVTRRLLERLLESRGYAVDSFADAESAWERLQTTSYPIALLDWVLPGMDGLELCRRIRSRAGGDRVVVVVLTARNASMDLQHVLDAGADDYLPKPVDAQALHVRLEIAERHAEARWHRQLADERVVAMVAELRKSRDDLLAILNELRVGSVLTDAEGHVVYLSAACANLLGIEPDGRLGMSWESLCPFTAADKAAIRQQFALPREQRRKLGARMQSPGGRRHWIEIEVQDDPRDPQGKILFLYDLTEVEELRRLLSDRAQFEDMIGKSDAMQHVYEQVRELAAVESTVLIEGETGTGKELVARALHATSRRKDGPFIAMNCAGLTDSLLGSQLFGHKRGAFTGAVEDHKGLFEAADGGTLFLDEIGDIPANVQTSLLRVLQEREIVRLGETKPRKIDVRVLAATHHDLAEDVANGTFRADLLYRIRVARITLPPLRERREDIPLIAASLLGPYSTASGKQVRDFSREATGLLLAYAWPGNVRELRSAIEFAVIRCRGNVIDCSDLPPEILEACLAPVAAAQAEPEANVRQRILDALQQTKGRRAEAARLLGMSRATFYRRLADLKIPIDA